jgi:hypothetical protein
MSSDGAAFKAFTQRAKGGIRGSSTGCSSEGRDKKEWNAQRTACARTLGEAILRCLKQEGFESADVLISLDEIAALVRRHRLKVPAGSIDRVVPVTELTKAVMLVRCQDALAYLVGNGWLRRVNQAKAWGGKADKYWAISTLRTKYNGN